MYKKPGMSKMMSLFLIVLLLFGGATLAQDVPVFCGDLAEADCTLLMESHDATQALNSANADFDLKMVIDGIPNMDAPLNISVTGNLAFTGADAIRDMATPEPEATPDMGAMMGLAADALTNLDAQLQLKVSLPPELTDASNGQVPSEINLELKLVDGTGYLNLDTLKDLINNPDVKGWYGLDVAGLLRMMGPQMAGMMQGMTGGAMPMGSYADIFSMSQDPSRMANFATIERTDDGSSDMATFEISVDLGKFYADPAMADMLRQQMTAQMSASGQKMTDEQIDQAMSMVTTMFEDMHVNVVEMIGVTDKYVHSIHVSFDMDMTKMMAAAGEKGAAPKVSFDMTITEDQFNAVEPITAPEDATVIPLESLGAMMGGAIPNQQ